MFYSFIISQIQHLKSTIRISDRNRVGISQIHHLSLLSVVVYQNVLEFGPLPLKVGHMVISQPIPWVLASFGLLVSFDPPSILLSYWVVFSNFSTFRCLLVSSVIASFSSSIQLSYALNVGLLHASPILLDFYIFFINPSIIDAAS